MIELSGSTAYIVAALGALLACSGVLGLLLALQVRELRAQQQRLEQSLQAAKRELETRLARVPRPVNRLLPLEHQLDQLRARIDKLELHGSDGHPFAQAVRLAQRGAGTQELVEACGMSPGEAELMLRMHALKKAG